MDPGLAKYPVGHGRILLRWSCALHITSSRRLTDAKKNLPKGRLGTVRASGSEYDSASCSSQSEAKEATESKSYTQQHDVYSCNQMGI